MAARYVAAARVFWPTTTSTTTTTTTTTTKAVLALNTIRTGAVPTTRSLHVHHATAMTPAQKMLPTVANANANANANAASMTMPSPLLKAAVAAIVDLPGAGGGEMGPPGAKLNRALEATRGVFPDWNRRWASLAASVSTPVALV